MRQGLAIGITAGLVSALVHFSAEHGGPVLRLLLLCLIPLPLLLAGLGWGWLPAAAGALSGTLATTLVDSPLDGVAYLIAFGIPAGLIAYLAYLSRPSPYDESKREWYPVGRLLAALSLYAGTLPLLVLPWTGGSFEWVRPVFTSLLKSWAKQSGDVRLSDPQIESMAETAVHVAPAAMAVYWLLIMVPNLYLAGRIAAASGRLARDWPDLPDFTYPPTFSPLLGLAVLASFAPGVLGVAGVGFTGALMFAHLLMGLALVHFLARRGARWLLWVTYAGLLLLQPYSALFAVIVAFAGLIEQILKLRQRLGAPPPTT
jgi:hypothetical protein